MAGIGLDGAIVARMTPGFKRRFGAWSYFVAGLPLALRTKPWRVRLTLDGSVRQTTLYWMVIGNTRSYGGFRNIAHRAIVDDGKLDVALMRRGGLRNLLFDGVRLLRGRHGRSPNIRYAQAERIEIDDESIPVQVDGEVHAQTPMRFEVAPAALSVIADDTSCVYGQGNPVFTAHYSGFVLGQDASVLGGTLNFNTPATSGSHGLGWLYRRADPSNREAWSPTANATATGAAESHSYWPPEWA